MATDRDQALRALVEAIRVIEQMELCRIDVDMPSLAEYKAIKALLGAIADYAHGYRDATPRLSALLTECPEGGDARTNDERSTSTGATPGHPLAERVPRAE